MTSSRPGAGSEKSAGCACSTPTASRISSSTARPGGLSSPATTASPTTSAAIGFQERRCGVGSRSPKAALTTCPRTLARVVLAGNLDPLELDPHTLSFSESRPRRRRELTVPRGRPSSSAISPGVYSSRWRSTITARCSGGSAASAPSSDESSAAVGSGAVCVDELGLAAQLAGARPVDRAVDDDPVQPGAEGPPAVEAVEVAHRGEEGLLGDVLGGRGVVDDEKGRPVRPRPVQPEERLDPRGGPSLRRAHEGALVAAGGHPLTVRPGPSERSVLTRP